MKKTLLFALVILISACHNTSKPGDSETHVWEPDPSTEMPCTQDMKTWGGKTVKNTALAGKWYLETWTAEWTPKGIVLEVAKDGCFTISISSTVSNEELNAIQECFPDLCKRGAEFKGHVRCHDNWCARGEGPDASCEVGFFDENDEYINAFAFVYCQINDDEFTFDNLWGSGIYLSLIPATKRTLKKLVYPDDYE